MIWREKRTLLLVIGVLLAANAMFFLTYRVQYQSRLDDLETRREEAERELENARTARMNAERSLQAYRKVEQDVQQIFDQHWSTQQRRLTAMIAEVKRLAVASSLQPRAYMFDRTESKQTGPRRDVVGANEVGMSFSVQGNYAQVRRLINLLELSRQFVIVDRISLAAAEADRLTLNLHLKTLFRDDSAESMRPEATANRL